MFMGVRGGGGSAQIDEEALVVVLVAFRRALAQGGGDVPCDLLALPHGVLGGHAADLDRLGGFGHGGAVPARVVVWGARHRHEFVDDQLPAVRFEIDTVHQRIGADADAPDQASWSEPSPRSTR